MSGNSATPSQLDTELLLLRIKRLMRHVWKHFREDRLLEEAASLSYTSLLALVPLLAVIFGVISVFPVFSQWSEQVKSFIFNNFVPAAGETVRGYVDTFLDSIGGLTLPGTMFLIVTALLLMFRIEVAFNKVWRVTTPRTLTNRIVMYWAVLTLCPIMIGAAVALGAQNVLAAFQLEEGLPPGIHRFGIFLLIWMAFTVIFVLVPNRKVKFRDAVVGAFLAAVLFEIAKTAFVAYIKNANYAVIYGALATVPIFLFWVYLVWAVVLFGASLAASLTTFTDQSRVDAEWPQRLELQMAYRILGHLWEAQRGGRSLFVPDLMGLETRVSEIQLRHLLNRLMEVNIVSHHPDEGWFLVRDLEDLSFADLQRAGGFYLPLAEIDQCPQDSAWDGAFVRALRQMREQGREALDTPLRRMYRDQLVIPETP